MRKYIFALFILAIHPAFSQSGEQEKVLPTASVQAAKVVHQPDGLHLYPTKEQKSASTTGYNLLHRLSLPAIRVCALTLLGFDSNDICILTDSYRQKLYKTRARITKNIVNQKLGNTDDFYHALKQFLA